MPEQREVLCTGKVSSTNEGVNVMPSFGVLNDHHLSARKSSKQVIDYLRDCVRATIGNLHPAWFGRIHDITLYQIQPGFYGFTVWGDVHVCQVTGPTGAHYFTSEQAAHQYISGKCAASVYRPAEFGIMMLETQNG